MSNNWLWNDFDIVRKHYPTGANMTELLPERGPAIIKAKAERIHTHCKTPFTDQEKALAKTYGQKLGEALMFLLPERTPYEIQELLENV